VATEVPDARSTAGSRTNPPTPPASSVPSQSVHAGRAFALLGTVQVTLIFTITLVAVPLPVIGRQLGLDQSQLVIVSAAYGLSFSGLLLFGGRLADRWGGRRMLTMGLFVFAAASAAAPTAEGFALLVATRFGQGVGAALVAPAAMVVLRAVFPQPSRYAHAMATWGGLSVLGATAGIVLSGVVATVASWRWMFAIPLLVAGMALLLSRWLLPAGAPGRRGTLDLPGAVLATAGVTLLSYGLVMTGDSGWSSATVAVPGACGLALLAAFVVVELRGRDPLLPLVFLANRPRGCALLVIALSAAATAVVCLFIALYLQQIQGWSPLRTSVAFVPYALSLIAAGRAAGRLVDRFGAPAVVVAGLVLAACGLILLARLGQRTTYVAGLLPGFLLLPAGVALTFAGATVLAVADAPQQQTGLAAGLANTAMELGPTVGLALLAAVAAARTAHITALGGAARAATASGYAWALGTAGIIFVLLAALIAVAVRAQRTRNRPPLGVSGPPI
jgi:MFS family permease